MPRGVKIPPSLRNIHTNLRTTYPDTFPAPAKTHGSLISSARQGVLWLNTALTVKAHAAGSHKGVWDAFTDKVLKQATSTRGVVVLAWGAHAIKRVEGLDQVSHFFIWQPPLVML